jgi:hypothetical protein
MAQVKPEVMSAEDAERLKAERDSLSKMLADTRKELADATEIRPLELVVAIDMSGSMRQPLANLKMATRQLAVNLPKLVEFRLGIIAYGGHNNVSPEINPVRIFPLTTLRDVPGRGGSGLGDGGAAVDERFGSFIDGLELRNGSVDVTDALRIACEMLAGGDKQARKTLVLIGDVGPYEFNNGQVTIRYLKPPARVFVDRSYEENALAHVRRLAREIPKVRVLAIYTGRVTPPAASDDPTSSYFIIQSTLSESVAFFKSVAEAAGPGRGEYSESPFDMLTLMLGTLIAGDKHR